MSKRAVRPNGGARNLDHERFALMVRLRTAAGMLEEEDTTGAIAEMEAAIKDVDDFIKRLLMDED